MKSKMQKSKKNSQKINSQNKTLLGRNWLSEAMQSVEDAVIATDTNGAVTEMNNLAEELTGWSFADSKGKPIDTIFDAINETTHQPIENPINKALKENKVTLLANHTILIKKDKSQRIIIDSAVPLYDDNAEKIGSALIFRDITDQSLNKKRLDKSMSTLNGILQNTGSIISIKDIEGKILLINKQAELVYNIKESELLGKKTIGKKKLTKGALQSDLNIIIKSGLLEDEEEIKHPDGSIHIYHAATFPLLDNEFNVYAICTILTDISERKTISNLKEQISTLANSKELKKDTLNQISRLKEKNKELQQFAYTIAHDLRGPISRVLGLANVLNIDPDFKINNQTILENVVNELTALDTIVKDMNETIADHEEEKHKEYVKFETKLRLIEKVLENEIKSSNASIVIDFNSFPGVTTVKSYLYSIMYNLLSNAIKYRKNDTPLTIHLQTVKDNNFICLIVKDNGLGIDMNLYKDKLFGLHNRFHGKEIEGRGLHLVKTQAEALGGKVEVESEVNIGSAFRIYFPADQVIPQIEF